MMRAMNVMMAAALMASCLSRTHQSTVTDAVYGAANSRSFSSGPVSTSLGGGKLGYEARRVASETSGFVEAGYLQAGSDWFSIWSLGAGVKVAVFRRGPATVGVGGLLEYQRAQLDRFRNPNHLVSLGVRGYGEVRVMPNVTLTLTVSAHAFADATSPTTCNDGSTSNSTGQGTCSWHDGIAFYNDELGNGTGLDAVVGVGVWFDAPLR